MKKKLLPRIVWGWKFIMRLIFLAALVVWVSMVFFDIIILLSNTRGLKPDIPDWVPRILLILCIILLYYYHTINTLRSHSPYFTDYIRSILLTGLFTVIVSLVFRLTIFLLGETYLVNNIIFGNVIYHAHLMLFCSFLIAAFVAWKKLILYQRSKKLINLVTVFELVLVISLCVDSVMAVHSSIINMVMIVVLGMIGVYISINVKWVAYLNVSQKWTSLLFLLSIFFYLFYFLYTINEFSHLMRVHSALFITLKTNAFALSLFGFVALYSLFAFLVVLFNLPTSSAFEQKLAEVVNFKRISQSIQTEENEDSVYDILFDGALSSSSVDAAWLRMCNDETKNRYYSIGESEITNVERYIIDNQVEMKLKRQILENNATENLVFTQSIRIGRFRSLLVVPLIVRKQAIAFLIFLKELSEGFNKETIHIISTFTNQANISIENFRLLQEAFDNERYKQEIKIASQVQKDLLPTKLMLGDGLDVASYSHSEDRVGGDYYDAIRVNHDLIAMIIADVSGKGTTAAFHMAQMKGIFHSLARQAMEPGDFIVQANRTLKACLDRTSFISVIYFTVHLDQKKLFYARAGHCPILYYSARRHVSAYLPDKGAVLGRLKDETYLPFVDVHEINYDTDDVMVLYTDGLVEANNKEGEEYGYHRLRQSLVNIEGMTAGEIQSLLINRLYEHSGLNKTTDDCTAMVIKF